MSDFTISDDLATAQLRATVAFADTGSANAYIAVYDAAENLLVSILMAKPCGTVTAGVLRLHQQLPGGDLIAASGVATHADWFAGNGALVARGTVTDEAGAGPFILGGADGTQLYAGGRAILGDTEIT